MRRWVAAGVFAVAVGLVAACGHEVTPPPKTSDLAGDVVVRFSVSGTLDFANYAYAVVVDTCGNGTPYPNGYLTGFKSYSYAFFIGAGFNGAMPNLVEYFVLPSSTGLSSITVPEDPSLEQFNANYDGLSNEFELVFKRAELDNPLGQSQPCPNLPPIAASPSPGASAGTSPAASPAPAPNPTTSAQATWVFNFFTIQNKTVIDALGPLGANDNSDPGPSIDVNAYQDVFIATPGGSTTTLNPSAAITGGEIINYR